MNRITVLYLKIYRAPLSWWLSTFPTPPLAFSLIKMILWALLQRKQKNFHQRVSILYQLYCTLDKESNLNVHWLIQASMLEGHALYLQRQKQQPRPIRNLSFLNVALTQKAFMTQMGHHDNTSCILLSRYIIPFLLKKKIKIYAQLLTTYHCIPNHSLVSVITKQMFVFKIHIN